MLRDKINAYFSEKAKKREQREENLRIEVTVEHARAAGRYLRTRAFRKLGDKSRKACLYHEAFQETEGGNWTMHTVDVDKKGRKSYSMGLTFRGENNYQLSQILDAFNRLEFDGMMISLRFDRRVPPVVKGFKDADHFDRFKERENIQRPMVVDPSPLKEEKRSKLAHVGVKL